MGHGQFTPEVYAIIREGAQRSAARVAPIVYEMAKPRTVIDVGCGEGWWAREFAKMGCDVTGFDESATDRLEDGVRFQKKNLAVSFVAQRDGRFDLAVSLEVAEHLEPARGPSLVEDLCRLAPVVLFSAAIPGQGGHGHLNERWPGYWADLFFEHGLVAHERLRNLFWDDGEVEPWYRQNLLLFASPSWLDERGLPWVRCPQDVVHPVVWEHRRQRP